jgi:protoporphyrinogen oxidase
MTGLAAARASGGTVYEAAETPGGICSSYYLAPGGVRRSGASRDDAYRFEIGGGHWIFGGDPEVLALIERLGSTRRYARRSSVFLPESRRFVPYPLQTHLRHLGPDLAERALAEMVAAAATPPLAEDATMREWLARSFGATLGALFFEPFHELYTGGLHTRIAPQDGYKSPVDLAAVAAGVRAVAPAAGYNVTFAYPPAGLDALARGLAGASAVEYGKRAARIDTVRREVAFTDGDTVGYERLVSTVPLDRALAMTGLSAGAPDPYTSVLVLNVGATRGPACPDDHWVYVPRSRAGFHRVGFYSNVDPAFLPVSARGDASRVSLYVERAWPGDTRPDPGEIPRYAAEASRELQDWGWIGAVEVADSTWIDVAYTWRWPGSRWREDALRVLEAHGVHQVGRYGRWTFQGIADSIRDGLAAGAALRAS